MTSYSSSTTHETGSVLLVLSVIIFLASLTAAAGTWYYVNQPLAPTIEPTTSSVPSPTTAANVLNPHIQLDPAVTADEATLQKNLITPLRQHYATQDEHLVTIAVRPHDDETYPTEVSLTLVDAERNERTVLFLYDLSVWNPKLLNNQP